MKFVLTPKEFQEKKEEFKSKIDKFTSDYHEFTRYVSPSNWRTVGGHQVEIDQLKHHVDKATPLKSKDLEQDWVRDQVLNDEEKEEWNAMKKYNL